MEKINNLYGVTHKRLKEGKRKKKGLSLSIIKGPLVLDTKVCLNNFDAIKKATTFDQCRFFKCSRLL